MTLGAHSIIPCPRRMEPLPGAFVIDARVGLVVGPGLDAAGARLSALISNAAGRRPPKTRPGASDAPSISLALDPSLRGSVGEEGYRLSITPQRVEMRAAAPAGALYAVQSLRQLLPPWGERGLREGACFIPCGEIEDAPRFPWRGLMLDEGRHFQGKETVKLLLELMSLHKLNTFHWHLTEDQGWRIQIRRFPELTRIGSIRKGTMKSPRGEPDGIPHSGFYSQEDIREIVAFANESRSPWVRRSTSLAMREAPWLPARGWGVPAAPTRCGTGSAFNPRSCALVGRPPSNSWSRSLRKSSICSPGPGFTSEETRPRKNAGRHVLTATHG